METFLGSALVTFDGQILECFGTRESSNGRLHIAALDRVEVDETRKEGYLQVHTIWGTSPILVTFPKDQRTRAEEFAAEVGRAKAGRA